MATQLNPQQQLLSPLPFPTSLPLLVASVAGTKIITTDPVRHLQVSLAEIPIRNLGFLLLGSRCLIHFVINFEKNQIHNLLRTVVELSSVPVPGGISFGQVSRSTTCIWSECLCYENWHRLLLLCWNRCGYCGTWPWPCLLASTKPFALRMRGACRSNSSNNEAPLVLWPVWPLFSEQCTISPESPAMQRAMKPTYRPPVVPQNGLVLSIFVQLDNFFSNHHS